MVYLSPNPPFPLSCVENHYAYYQMPPPLYDTMFSIGNFHWYTSPQYAYYLAPSNLCHTLPQEKLDKIGRNVTPFKKLTRAMLDAYIEADNDLETSDNDLEASESSLSLDEEKIQCGDTDDSKPVVADADCLDNECKERCASFSDDSASSAFGDDEDCVFTASEFSPACSRSSTPDFFPFVSSMKATEFPPLHEALPASETGSSEDSTSNPVSKNARRAFSRKTKWRVVPNGILTEGESGYQSEFSAQWSVADGEVESGSSDSNVNLGSFSEDTNDPKLTHQLKRVRDISNLTLTEIEGAPESSNVSRMDLLSEHICAHYERVTQTEKTLMKKLKLRDMLFYSLTALFPMCGLYVVGSSLNGFGSESSDMDLCLVITNGELNQRTDGLKILRMAEEAFALIPVVQEQTLIEAKVPILRIKFTGPFSDIIVDLNANNVVAIRNTHLLCYYAFFDWRVRPLIAIVKEWAKSCNINDACRSSFTSYSLVLMVFHFLQAGMQDPVLPSLQHVFPQRFTVSKDIRSLNVSLPLDSIPSSSNFVSNKDSTLGELLIGFFHYYAHVYDFEKNAISIRLGRTTERKEVIKNKLQWSPVFIEEPFTHLNTAHSIYDERVFETIKVKLREAYEILEETYDLNKLLNVHTSSV